MGYFNPVSYNFFCKFSYIFSFSTKSCHLTTLHDEFRTNIDDMHKLNGK